MYTKGRPAWRNIELLSAGMAGEEVPKASSYSEFEHNDLINQLELQLQDVSMLCILYYEACMICC